MIAELHVSNHRCAKRHYHRYSVIVDGERLVHRSPDPEHDLARALTARGLGGVVELRDGRTGRARSFINVDIAARWRVIDGDHGLKRERWRPSPLKGLPTRRRRGKDG